MSNQKGQICDGDLGAYSAGRVRAPAQVVAVLNPIAGERMQEELETRISSLQQELDKAHSQVRVSCCRGAPPCFTSPFSMTHNMFMSEIATFCTA